MKPRINFATITGFRLSRGAARELEHEAIARATQEWLRKRRLRAVPRENAPSLVSGDPEAQIGLLGPIQALRLRRARPMQPEKAIPPGFQPEMFAPVELGSRLSETQKARYRASMEQINARRALRRKD